MKETLDFSLTEEKIAADVIKGFCHGRRIR
jgi:hypothetical protein